LERHKTCRVPKHSPPTLYTNRASRPYRHGDERTLERCIPHTRGEHIGSGKWRENVLTNRRTGCGAIALAYTWAHRASYCSADHQSPHEMGSLGELMTQWGLGPCFFQKASGSFGS